jgi:cytoskeleton protein RodZ
MNAENQHRAIYEKISAMLDGFKKRLAKKREGGVIPPDETISKAETELLESIHLSEIEIGQILQEARETAKISLEDAEASLRIKKEYLIALESGNFNLLPGTTYVSGFLKSYTQYLGLNINQSLMRIVPSNSNSPNPNETILGTLPNKKSSPSLVILAISLVATGGGYFAWYSFDNHPLPNNEKHRMLTEDKLEKKLSVSSKENEDQSFAAPKTEKTVTNAKDQRSEPKATKSVIKIRENSKFEKEGRLNKITNQKLKRPVKTPTTDLQQKTKKPTLQHKQSKDGIAPTKKSDNKVIEARSNPISDATGKINITASEDTWIEIQNVHKKIVFNRIIAAGEIIKLKYEKGLSVSTGNTRALLITHKNKKFIGFDKNDRISKNNQLNKWQE